MRNQGLLLNQPARFAADPVAELRTESLDHAGYPAEF
jgi:hypothetical protein